MQLTVLQKIHQGKRPKKKQDTGCHCRIASNFVVQRVAVIRDPVFVAYKFMYMYTKKRRVNVCGPKACKV